MKNKLTIILLILVYLLAFATAVYAEPLRAETAFGTAVIDGKNTDGEWDDVPSYPIDKFKKGTRQDESFSASFKVKFDGENLYLFIEVRDATVAKWSGGVKNTDDAKQDRITVYIDYSNTGSGFYSDPFLKEYQITTNRWGDYGQYDCIPFDLDNNIELKVVEHEDNKGYTTEYKLNLAGITKEKINADKEIGFDIQVSDMDTNSNSVRLGAYGWNDKEDKAWNDTSALGKLVLKVAAQQDETPGATDNPDATPTEGGNDESSPDATSSATPDATTSASPDSTTTATPGGRKEETQFPWAVVIIVAVVLLAAGVAVYFLVVKKKR